MGKGIPNRGTKVHQSKTKKFKWEDELDDDEFKFIKQFRKGQTPNDEDEKEILKLSHMKRLRELEKQIRKGVKDKRNCNLISLEEYSLPSTN